MSFTGFLSLDAVRIPLRTALSASLHTTAHLTSLPTLQMSPETSSWREGLEEAREMQDRE